MTISTLTIPTAEPSNMESTSISTISSTVITDGLYGRYSPGYFHANHSNAAVSVGVATDVVALSNAGVNLGLGAAKAGVMYGFWWAKMATYLPQAAVKMMQESSYSDDTEETDTLRGNVHLYSIVSSALGAANALVSTAESITLGSLEASHKITTGSLSSTQSLLRMAGAHQGHLYRLAGSTILDKPTAQAIGFVAGMLFEFAGETDGSMTEIALGLQTLWKLQQHGVAPVTGAVIYSIPDELPEVDLYMQYASGAFGWILLTAMGTIPLLEGIRTDKQAIAHLTRVREEDIVYTQTTSKLYRPAYYIALDRRRKKIVLAFRGSSNALDMLTDLNCESIPYSFNGVHGEAHAGFARSAHRLSTELMPIMVDLLRENEGYHVVLTGHSLGAAVATMVALEWAHLFDDLKCYAYAAPACVSLPVSLEAQCVVTSVVLGSDLVPRLSRTSLEYLRDVGLMLGQNQELRHEVIAAVARCERISTGKGDKNDDTDINMDTDTNVDMHMYSTSVHDHRRARDDTNGYMEDIDTDATTSTLNRHESLDGFLGEDLVGRLSLLDRRTSVMLRDDDLSLLRSASESTPHTDTATHIGMHASNTPSRSASCSPAPVHQVNARVQRLPNDTNAQTDAEEWVAIEDTVESDTASLEKEQAIQTCRVLYDKLYDAQPNRLELLAAGKILFLCHKTGEGILTNGELAPHWSRVILSRSMFWLHLPGYYTHHINNHNRLAIAAKSG